MNNYKIVYEDNDILVLDKKHGVLVHSTNSLDSNTISNALLTQYPSMKEIDKERGGIVHRLDRGTSGLLLAAKNIESHKFITKQFIERSIIKIYDVLVYGETVPYIKIDTNLSRNGRRIIVSSEGRRAITEMFLKETNTRYSFVKCRIYTGRTHQIRVHMKSIYHSVVGDKIYGGREAERLFLHASEIEFTHPNGERKYFSSESNFLQMMKMLK